MRVPNVLVDAIAGDMIAISNDFDDDREVGQPAPNHAMPSRLAVVSDRMMRQVFHSPNLPTERPIRMQQHSSNGRRRGVNCWTTVNVPTEHEKFTLSHSDDVRFGTPRAANCCGQG
jgi:hypothetical protein